MKIAQSDRDALAEAAALVQAEDRVRKVAPAVFYEPHENGQKQFHESQHRVRCLWPGNRWGKSTALGMEADHSVSHRVRPGWHEVPPWPQTVLWFCRDLRQWDLLRPDIEEGCLTKGYTYNETKHFYKWRGGDKLWIVPGDRDWSYIEGINPDKIIVDEECPVMLWRALRMRAFGKRFTRYLIGATAMKGLTWMYTDLYKVWLKHHSAIGIGEDKAMKVQSHPTIWAWPKGSIEDNPCMTAEMVKEARALTWSSAKEKIVRDCGGFQSLSGDCIFDGDGMVRMGERLEALEKKYGPGIRGAWEIAEPFPIDPHWHT